MKKFLTFVAILAGVLALTFLSVDKAEAAVDNVNNLNGIFEKYYNEGVYTKETKIYLSESAQTDILNYKDLFHAGATSLERTTYYSGDALWMSRGKEAEGVKYSYYGTAYEAGLPVGVTNATADEALVAPEDAKVVLSGEGKESMEAYYVTMNDMVATEAQAWSVEGNVYKSSDLNLIDAFRNFTAPCFLALNENTKDFFQWSHVTVEEKAGKLYLSLYMDETSEGYVTGENYLFSQAVVYFEGSEEEFTVETVAFGGTKQGNATYDADTNVYSFEVELKTWNSVIVYVNGEVVDVLDSKYTVTGDIFHNMTANGAGNKLYYEYIYDWDAGHYTDVLDSSTLYTATGGTYLFTLDADTLALNIDYQEPVVPLGSVKVDTTNVDGGADKVAVWTGNGTVMYDGSKWFGSNGWRGIIVVDAEGKICYAVVNPVGGYGNPYSDATNNYKASYARHSSYKDYLTNPAFSNLGTPTLNSWGVNSVTFNVVIPEGGFAVTMQGVGQDNVLAAMGLSGAGALQTHSTNVDSIRLSYDAANGLVVVSQQN